MWQLQKARPYIKAKKCEFHSDSIEYSGYILFPSRLSMFSNKIKTIQNWPESRKIKDVQVVLVFANFYHRFIHNYLNIAVLLIWLTQKNTTWNFDSLCCEAFNILKKVFISTLILTYWIPNAQMIVDVMEHWNINNFYFSFLLFLF